ncbi:GNAT family N-acetyltransferase [Halobacillus karajensis]|uniref:Ribosomal-protein-alanine acetyltransferase n=1 Tax=Halobacillus karajensis TaxID=195088 RepID=A0A024P8Z5_9BACI|nr:GNAT family N-acetyltransferase [Halobacillus karajensis]CDQ20039.1 ribosomal-protein-alanine acetyltransferase [Halobacillus karajensis]CDQ25298.1 ribosomal-protein-alanine acetyltransferase [Halobacillus karajensis]CDQ28341.1 ribosomal-protein-alanine acetyltransferase [Halobacillus karajensis]
MNIVEQWKQEDSDFIRKKVIEHNMKELPEELKTPNEDISLVLKDESGAIYGVITANMFWHHMHVESLWVDENLRGEGYGRVLLEKMEHLALEKGCRFIYLDTFSFQAPEFYKQNGYEVFGMIEDHPRGFNQYFLYKRFDR